MSLITRSYSFQDGDVAYGSQVDAEIANIVNTLNSLDQGNTTWSEVDVTTLTLHSNLVMGGNKVTGLGSANTSGDAIPYPIVASYLTAGTLTTTQIASDTITGSTANSGGSAGNIDQGTISTPDFRTNAVSQIQSSLSLGTQTGTTATVTTKQITTIGKPVLIMASVNVNVASATILSKVNASAGICISRDGGSTFLSEAHTVVRDLVTAGQNNSYNVTLFYTETPAAATYTYTLYAHAVGVTYVGVDGYSLIVTELRA